MTTLDLAELAALEAYLGHAGDEIVAQAVPVVSKGALNVKTEAARIISGHRHLPYYPRYAIDYDVAVEVAGVEAEIGANKADPQGALGNILEYGTRNNPPIPHLSPALDLEEPRFVDQAEALAIRTLGKLA